MAKGKGLDPIAGAQELAEHNINPYYWVNKVTSYTYARWMAQKRLAAIALPMYLCTCIAMVMRWSRLAADTNTSMWHSMMAELSNGSGPLILVLMVFYTVVSVIMVLQLLSEHHTRVHETAVETHKKRKRQPKRRKDYH